MSGFSEKLLIYVSVFVVVAAVAYAVMPVLVRSFIRKIVVQRCGQFAQDSRQWIQSKLKEGQDNLIPAGQAAILGHLIQPHLEKLSHWVLDKIDEHGATPLADSCADACVEVILRYRLPIALICAQAATGLLTLGYLLLGVI